MLFPENYNRQTIRLRDYDYRSLGGYFITICTHNRQHLFGEIVNGCVDLNDVGQMVQSWWNDLPCRFPEICLDEFIIMPDHLHGIIIVAGVGATRCGRPYIRHIGQ